MHCWIHESRRGLAWRPPPGCQSPPPAPVGVPLLDAREWLVLLWRLLKRRVAAAGCRVRVPGAARPLCSARCSAVPPAKHAPAIHTMSSRTPSLAVLLGAGSWWPAELQLLAHLGASNGCCANTKLLQGACGTPLLAAAAPLQRPFAVRPAIIILAEPPRETEACSRGAAPVLPPRCAAAVPSGCCASFAGGGSPTQGPACLKRPSCP